MNKYFIFILSVSLMACGTKTANSPTYGEVKISADESLEQIIREEEETFEGIYQNAELAISFGAEKEVVEMLLRDSVDLGIMTRPLSQIEEDQLNEQKIWSETYRIAFDAVAILVNLSNPDSLLKEHEIQKILSGEISRWEELGSGGLQDSIVLVFDQNNSGVSRYMQDSVNAGRAFGNNVFAVDGNEEVIQQVSRNVHAIGFIGVNWISDASSQKVQKFRKETRVAAIAGSEDPETYYKPYQAYIATKSYPFVRPVYAISREGRAGLASGFTAFLASERGQRIILKAGLVPVTMPVRIVQLADQPQESQP